MRKTQAFAAVLCSAALACGMAMPAFAEGPVSSNTNEITAEAGGSTVIKGATSAVDIVDEIISAKVPVSMSVVLGEGGNGKFEAPSSTAYKLTNTGNVAIKIDTVSATPAGSGWTLGELKSDGTVDAASIGENDKIIAIALKGVTGTNLTTAGAKFQNNSIATGAFVGLDVSGATKVGAKVTMSSETLEDMANIIYTIAKA